MPTSRYIFGTLPWYSVLIVTGICTAILLASREEKRLGLPKDTVIDLALTLIPLGVLGARLYYVVFAWDTFRGDVLSIFKIWQGGLAIYGGILGGLLAAVLFAWRRKLSMLTLFDMIVPGLALAQAIGRWGNFFNMEAYGAPVSDPAWQFFPAAVLIPAAGRQVWHMATFFYESMWDLGVFAVLWQLRTRTKHRGDLALWYALLYGGGRLLIEGLREDSLYTLGGTGRVSQLLSVGLCTAVTVIFAWRALRHTEHRCLLCGAACGASALILCLVLPAPAAPFPLGNLVWAVLAGVAWTAGAALCIAKRRIAWVLLPAFAGLLTGARCAMALHEMVGLAASVLLCALYALLALAACVCLYLPAAAASRAPYES